MHAWRHGDMTNRMRTRLPLTSTSLMPTLFILLVGGSRGATATALDEQQNMRAMRGGAGAGCRGEVVALQWATWTAK